jgi:hypothetical protein
VAPSNQAHQSAPRTFWAKSFKRCPVVATLCSSHRRVFPHGFEKIDEFIQGTAGLPNFGIRPGHQPEKSVICQFALP